MNRRAFVAGLGSFLAAPIAAEAHFSARVYRIEVVLGPGGVDMTDDLRGGIRESGWVQRPEFRRAETRLRRRRK
jgi:hypothetical protein